MQQSLQNVNHARIVGLLGELYGQEASDGFVVEVGEGNMDMRRQDAGGPDREEVFERWIGMDEERSDGVVGVEFIVGEDAAVGQRETVLLGLGDMHQIADDADQDEGNRHHRAIGIERPRDNEDEQYRQDNTGFRPELESIMFGSAPFEKDIAEIG